MRAPVRALTTVAASALRRLAIHYQDVIPG